MTVAVKNKKPVLVSPAALRQAGFKNGDELELKVSRRTITILPKSQSADDEYTPAQRRVIDARLKKSLEEVKRGHTAGPFNTADEMIASLKQALRTSVRKKTTTRVR